MSQKQMSINIKSLVPAFCPACDSGAEYELIYEARLIPGFVSPTGKQTIFLIPVYRCCNCRKVFFEEQLIYNKSIKKDLPG
jgi:hypothetical protein